MSAKSLLAVVVIASFASTGFSKPLVIKFDAPRRPPVKAAHSLVATSASHAKQPEHIDQINLFRIETCAHQKSDSAEYPNCVAFMTEQCNPGPDSRMNGTPGERSTSKGWCQAFFNRDAAPAAATSPAAAPAPPAIKDELDVIEKQLEKAEAEVPLSPGEVELVGPLPFDFPARFVRAVVEATGCSPSQVRIDTEDIVHDNVLQHPVHSQGHEVGKPVLKSFWPKLDIRLVKYRAPKEVLYAVAEQSTAPDSHLNNGELADFLRVGGRRQDGLPADASVGKW